MANPILIVHGWSDNYESFTPLKTLLTRTGYKAEDVLLGNYESMQDDVTFDDVSHGLQERLDGLVKENKIKLDPFSLDVIVHSTGGPVVRNWLSHYLTDVCKGDLARCPIRRLIMLAPANFGSRLAAQGKSALAKLFKGGMAHGFQTGRRILEGLELGSPFLWNLADRDLFTTRLYPCDPTRGPFVFILSGMKTYGEFKGFVASGADEDGSDGTIRAAAASLDSIKLTADFRDPVAPSIKPRSQSNDPSAFKLVPDYNHSTIVPRDPADANHPTFAIIKECLAVSDVGAHKRLRDRFDDENQRVYQPPAATRVNQYQQFLVRVRDNMGNRIEDYRLEFHVVDDTVRESVWNGRQLPPGLQRYQQYTAELADRVIRDVQTHSVDSSYRTFFVNLDARDALERKLAADPNKPYIAMNLDAMPPAPGVSYRTDELVYVPLNRTFQDASGQIKTFFKANTSTLVDITLRLFVHPEIVKIVT